MASDHQPIMSFRPILCVGSSAKDMVINCNLGGPRTRRKKTDGRMFDEPMSPRVGCMGQIKREKGDLSGTKGNKFYKLKKILSGKTFSQEFSAKFNGHYRLVSIIDMDPPLPVPKHAISSGSDPVSLWMRRRGRPLKCLQIQHQHRQRSQTSN
ncbi:uncharacterized protein LOC131224096 [Magnolia sinica]|uniref:uncharacterized protein LOC131224096 n=1 Tax=Magnolia sinica TaxID=86752 RepID=UPI002659F24C|nr:uncharacterized protein LOC131224096 [Magnolia sinica]